MERYDYREAVCADVEEYIRDHFDEAEFIERLEEDRDGLEQELNDDMFVSDQVTGNASGSYTFNTWKAEEYLMHNLDLLGEACDMFGGGVDVLKSGAEACDVTIRCYLLGECLYHVLDMAQDDEDYLHQLFR